MADREAWLKALALITGPGVQSTETPCPNCGHHTLEVRYIADPDTRIGYVLFWCGTCLHGIRVSRARVPEGEPILPLDDPASVAGVPDFVRDE